jgi:hypothetical protein
MIRKETLIEKINQVTLGKLEKILSLSHINLYGLYDTDNCIAFTSISICISYKKI